MNKKNLILGLALAAVLAAGGALILRNLTGSAVQARTAEVYVDLVVAGEIVPAAGVWSTRTLEFESFPRPELLWIIGYGSEPITGEGTPPASDSSFESAVTFNATRHARIFELPVPASERLFTLPGVPAEVNFPAGFGMPFYSDETLTMTARVLDPAIAGAAANLRQRLSLRYVLDRDLDQPMKPLFVTTGQEAGSSEENAVGGDVVNRVLRPPYDTRVHLITGQLQPFLDSLELRDLSSDELIYAGGGGTDGADDMPYFSSADGVKLFEGREYELVARYDRTRSGEEGSLASPEVYLRDKLFKKRPRVLTTVKHIEEPVTIGDERLVIYTNLGEFQIGLYPEAAPNHVEQLLRLARLGIYDGVPFHRVEPGFLIQLGYPEGRLGPPLTAEQKAAIRPLKAEITDIPQSRWTVSMALHDNADPDSSSASFFVLCDEQRRLDQRFTIVGRILGGLGTLDKIASVPLDGTVPVDPVFIERIAVMTRAEIIASRGGR